MSLAAKIVSSAAIPVALVVAAAASGYVAMDDAWLGNRRALARVAPVVHEVAEAKGDIAALARLHGRWIAIGGPGYEAAWTQRTAGLDDRLGKLEASLETPRERQQLARARRAVARHRHVVAKNVDGRATFRHLDATGRRHAVAAGERAQRAITAIAREVDATARRADRHAGGVARHARNGMIAGALVAAGLVFLVSSWVGRRVAIGLAYLTDAAGALERGRLDQAIPVGGRDELGQLAVAFESLAASLGDRDRVCEDAIRRIGHELTEPLVTIRDATRALASELAGAPGSREQGLVLLIGDAARDLLRRVDRMGDESTRPAAPPALEVRLPVTLPMPERRLLEPIALDEEHP